MPPPQAQRVGADLLWVESQALGTEIGGVEAKEGDNVSAGHDFGKYAHGRKV